MPTRIQSARAIPIASLRQDAAEAVPLEDPCSPEYGRYLAAQVGLTDDQTKEVLASPQPVAGSIQRGPVLQNGRIGRLSKLVVGPGDIEIHYNPQQKQLYCLDVARVFPPEPAPRSLGRDECNEWLLTRRLRPELVAQSPEPLSSDALSNFQQGPDSDRHNQNVRKLHEKLMNDILPQLAKELSGECDGIRVRRAVAYSEMLGPRQGRHEADLMSQHGMDDLRSVHRNFDASSKGAQHASSASSGAGAVG